MKDIEKVYQTNMTRIGGDCMQACIASILCLPLESVPNFWEGVEGEDHQRWWNNLRAYLETIGYCYIETPWPWGDEKDPGKYPQLFTSEKIYVIVCVPSQRHNNTTHATVGRIHYDAETKMNTLYIVHDPNPEGKIGEHRTVLSVGFLIKNSI